MVSRLGSVIKTKDCKNEKFRAIEQIIAESTTAGNIMLMCNNAFALRRSRSSIGEDFIIQRLWLSSEIEQLDITVVADIIQKIKVNIAQAMPLFVILMASSDSTPLVPRMAIKIENTIKIAGPIIVFVMYAGIDK